MIEPSVEHNPLLALVADAVRAPSSHNTQPWLFHLGDDTVELHADRTRALPVNDPYDRELVISCGAALFNLLLSATHHGWLPETSLTLGGDPDHLATVTLRRSRVRGDDRLWVAIPLRHTYRRTFCTQPVPSTLVGELKAAAKAEGAWAVVLGPSERSAVVDLVAKGDEMQFADPSWRRELAAWMHPRRSGDGLTVPPVTGAISRLVVSTLDRGERTGKADAALTAAAPLVMVLGTYADGEAAWLCTGQALQRVLLTAAAAGVQAGFSNQPCQVGSLRSELADRLGRENPQVVLRLGFPTSESSVSPRRAPELALTAT